MYSFQVSSSIDFLRRSRHCCWDLQGSCPEAGEAELGSPLLAERQAFLCLGGMEAQNQVRLPLGALQSGRISYLPTERNWCEQHQAGSMPENETSGIAWVAC